MMMTFAGNDAENSTNEFKLSMIFKPDTFPSTQSWVCAAEVVTITLTSTNSL